LAASSKQTSEQSQCPDVLYKHWGETITWKIQSWGVLAVSCLSLGKTGHGCCTFSFSGVACSTMFGVLGAAEREHLLEQERGQEMLTDAQEMLMWRSEPSLRGFKTTLSKEVCTRRCWEWEVGPRSSWGNADPQSVPQFPQLHQRANSQLPANHYKTLQDPQMEGWTPRLLWVKPPGLAGRALLPSTHPSCAAQATRDLPRPKMFKQVRPVGDVLQNQGGCEVLHIGGEGRRGI